MALSLEIEALKNESLNSKTLLSIVSLLTLVAKG